MANIQHNSGASEDTRTIVTVLLLIFVYPIGLLLMWFWAHWSKWVKILVTLPVVIILLVTISTFSLLMINPAAKVQKADCITACEKAGQSQQVCETSCSNLTPTPIK